MPAPTASAEAAPRPLAGVAHHSHWLNLQRDPRASVLIGETTSKMTARSANPEEHNRLWLLATETHPGYARYQERTTRLIPIVVLTPLDAEALTPR